MVEDLDYNVPEPLKIHLKSIGKPITLNRENFFSEFPSLPTANPKSRSHGGYFKALVAAPEGALLYAEIPTVGITGEAITHLLSEEAPGPYLPSVAENQHNLQAQRNLLNYAHKLKQKAEVTSKLLEIGILPATFPESIDNTGTFIPLPDQIPQSTHPQAASNNHLDPYLLYQRFQLLGRIIQRGQR